MINLLKIKRRNLPRAIFIIALGSFILGCSQNNIKKEYYDNGSLKSELNYVDEKLNGVQKYYYPNGNIKEIHNIANETTQYEEYFEDGNLASKGSIKNKKRVGKWNYYQNQSDRKLKALGMYNKDGLKDGKWEYYDNEETKKIVFWDIFIDTTNNFVINYPRDWSIRTDIENAILMAMPKEIDVVKLKNVNFNIIQIDLEDSATLEEVASINVSEAAKAYEDFNFKVLKKGEDKVNGLETKWYAFSVDKNNNTHVVIQFYIMAESGVFQISFFVLEDYYSEYLTLYKEIAYSFNELF